MFNGNNRHKFTGNSMIIQQCGKVQRQENAGKFNLFIIIYGKLI